MDENEFEGTIRNVGGKIQDAAGGLTGDAELQAEGKFNQAAGKAQETLGAAAEELRERVSHQPLTALAIVGGVCFALGLLARR